MDPALPFREKEESQGMRQAITISVVGGVLLLSTALAYGGGHIEASTKFLLAWGNSCEMPAWRAHGSLSSVRGRRKWVHIGNPG